MKIKERKAMKKIRYTSTLLLSGLLLLMTGCRDDMAKLNSNPSQVTDANISYLFAKSVIQVSQVKNQ